MGKVSMKGVCDMHVHTNPDLRLRAYDDFELADAAIRVGARAIVIKTHLGFTVNRAYLTNQYVKRVYGENTGFTMYGGVVMNKVIGGINPEAVEKGLKLGAKEIWLPTQSAKRHLEKMGKNPADGIELVRDGKVVPELLDVFKLIKDHDAVLGTAHVSPEEAFVVVEAARNAGVKKIVITHPEWWVVDMSMDDQVRLVKDYDVILERCYAQSNRLSRLLRDISVLTRMDEAANMIDMERVDISLLVGNIINEVALELDEKHITVVNSLKKSIQIKGNYSLIYSIFRNLMDNAIAYAGANIQININCFREDEGFYYFSFADTGVGVSPEHLNRLFERFYRVDKGRSRKLGGTGLGLAIVKNAVIIHGGSISAKNNQGGGLEFVFTLAKER